MLNAWLIDHDLKNLSQVKNFVVSRNPEVGLIIKNDQDQLERYFLKVEKKIQMAEVVKFANYNEFLFRSP